MCARMTSRAMGGVTAGLSLTGLQKLSGIELSLARALRLRPLVPGSMRAIPSSIGFRQSRKCQGEGYQAGGCGTHVRKNYRLQVFHGGICLRFFSTGPLEAKTWSWFGKIPTCPALRACNMEA